MMRTGVCHGIFETMNTIKQKCFYILYKTRFDILLVLNKKQFEADLWISIAGISLDANEMIRMNQGDIKARSKIEHLH